jgi:YD repeat-containing protein
VSWLEDGWVIRKHGAPDLRLATRNDTDNHRLETIYHETSSSATISKFDYTYDAVGNILSWRQQAETTAVMWRYGYDAADQLTLAVKESTAQPPEILERFAYAYDPAGNRTVEQIDDAVMGASYDELNRLVSRQPSGALRVAGTLSEPATVTIDGQPATVTAADEFAGTVPVASGTNTFSVSARDASGNVQTDEFEVENTGSSETLTYDANGNLTSDGTRTFEWDARNQLVAVEVGTHW